MDPDHVRLMKGKSLRQTTLDLGGVKGIPVPPPILDEVGLECWNHMVGILSKIGIISLISRNKLTRYCQAWQDWMEVQSYKKQLSKMQRLDTKGVYMGRHKHWRALASEAESVMSDFEREYGLTPACAMKIRLPGQKETPRDEFTKFVKAKPVSKQPIDVDTEDQETEER